MIGDEHTLQPDGCGRIGRLEEHVAAAQAGIRELLPHALLLRGRPLPVPRQPRADRAPRRGDGYAPEGAPAPASPAPRRGGGAAPCASRRPHLAPGGIYRDEETLWRDTLAKDPGSPLANLNLGNIRFAAGDLAAARPHFERALVDKPDFAQAWHNLGMVVGREGDLTGAARAFELAIRHHPYYAEAYENLGVAYGMQGDDARAAAALERSVALKPGNLGAWLNLVRAYERLGRPGQVAELASSVAQLTFIR